MKPPIRVPPVHLLLRSHPPGPARVGLVQRPLWLRTAGAALSLVLFWGACPYLVWVPPHYPWPLLSLSAGAFLAHRFWTGRFVVRWFAGACPRCGAPLHLAPGTPLSLPHRLTCFGCHFEPQLDVYSADDEEALAADHLGIRHVLAECAGTWHEVRRWDEAYVSCSDCGARYHATPAVLSAARTENERGAILDQLAAEGKYLT
jgi:hypothetical protein